MTATEPAGRPATVPDTLVAADLPEIQALVFRGWGTSLPWAAFLFVRLPDEPARARAWLAEVAAEIAWAAGPSPDTLAVAGGTVPGRLQLGLTPAGLARLGVHPAVVARFPQEAKVGMAARARVLGDPVAPGAALPTDWTLDLRTADAMLLLYAASDADVDALAVAQRARAERHGGAVIADERSSAWGGHEPFGFADGLSQPVIKGQPRRATMPTPNNEIAAGEVVLGYRNEYGQVPQSPTFDRGEGHDGFDLGKHGTYLVFRKLEQQVGLFWKTFAELGERLQGATVAGGTVPTGAHAAAHWLAARAMGRWTNGNPVHLCPHAPGERLPDDRINDFVYGADPHGLACPIAAHVRRANPRDQRGGPPAESWKVVRRHRILRRGRAYGELTTAEAALRGEVSDVPSGLLFVCLQANIAHGFEFVQQIWNANPGFHGLYQEPDPIVGPGGSTFTIPAEPVRLRLPALPRFVVPRGGGYFFMPSRAAVTLIAAG